MTDDGVFLPSEMAEISEIQALRLKLIRELTADGKVPAKGQVLLASLIDGVDRSAMTRAKMRADKKNDETAHNAVKVVAEMLKSVNTRTYRPGVVAERRIIPEELLSDDFVPGELDIGNEPLSIGQVMGG